MSEIPCLLNFSILLKISVWSSCLEEFGAQQNVVWLNLEEIGKALDHNRLNAVGVKCMEV